MQSRLSLDRPQLSTVYELTDGRKMSGLEFLQSVHDSYYLRLQAHQPRCRDNRGFGSWRNGEMGCTMINWAFDEGIDDLRGIDEAEDFWHMVIVEYQRFSPTLNEISAFFISIHDSRDFASEEEYREEAYKQLEILRSDFKLSIPERPVLQLAPVVDFNQIEVIKKESR